MKKKNTNSRKNEKVKDTKVADLTAVTWSKQYKIIVTGHTNGDM